MFIIESEKIKKKIGERFRQFREAIYKTQTQLAQELNVYQSTITNIEVGKTFPNIKYLHHFHKTYLLNINWLLSGEGDIFEDAEKKKSSGSLLNCHLSKRDYMYDKYVELLRLMQIPVVEQVVLAKLVELKVLAKEEINEFLAKEKSAASAG